MAWLRGSRDHLMLVSARNTSRCRFPVNAAPSHETSSNQLILPVLVVCAGANGLSLALVSSAASSGRCRPEKGYKSLRHGGEGGKGRPVRKGLSTPRPAGTARSHSRLPVVQARYACRYAHLLCLHVAKGSDESERDADPIE